jgi:hypothetical protein
MTCTVDSNSVRWDPPLLYAKKDWVLQRSSLPSEYGAPCGRDLILFSPLLECLISQTFHSAAYAAS